MAKVSLIGVAILLTNMAVSQANESDNSDVNNVSEDILHLQQTLDGIDKLDEQPVTQRPNPMQELLQQQPVKRASPLSNTPRAVKDILNDIEVRMNIDNDGDAFTMNQGDCDDTDPLTYPTAFDSNDGIDNDCDGIIDNGTTETH